MAHTDGPVTYRGEFKIASGTGCKALVDLNVPRWTGDFVSFPSGCPRSYREPPRKLRQVIADRTELGLDPDLAGNPVAIARRARSLLRAWRRGNPVARWTSMKEAFGMPLRPGDQVELEYRDRYRERFQDVVEEGDWVARNAAETYAGYQIDETDGGIIYVGFTKEPEAMLEKLRRRLIAPQRFKPFPVTPKYTEAELERLSEGFLSSKVSQLWNLVNSVGIDYLANRVEVGTEHVARVRSLIAARYGPKAPFEVVFKEHGVLLKAARHR